MIERSIRTRLFRRFGTTLPRFDLMAQLERSPDGLRMGELSRRMMVTGGNVTGITDQLVAEGLVERRPIATDRRAHAVRLTAKGRRRFMTMAAEHERWIEEITGELPAAERGAPLLTAWSPQDRDTRRCGPQRQSHSGRPDMSMQHQLQPLRDYRARHFRWDASADGRVATVTLDRPEKKNPLTFDAYAELRDLFRALVYASDVRSVVVTGAGGNFCSGGDVHEIIGPLTKMTMPELLAFTRMTGDLVKAMRHCPQPIVAAIDGICAGAGAMIALASDFRLGTPAARTAFLFTRVGLAGCDMGACTLLPRMIGQGRAAELLYTGRAMTADEGAAWGFFNRLVDSAALEGDAQALPGRSPTGPRSRMQ